MTIEDLQSIAQSCREYHYRPYLILHRDTWEFHPVIKWSKKELDAAEKEDDGYIGHQCGMRCYLPKKI